MKHRENSVRNWIIIICVFVYSLIGILLSARDNIQSYEQLIIPYNMSTYLLNYSDGFGSRLLVGSLLQLLYGCPLSAKIVGLNNIVVNLLDSTFATVLLCKGVERIQNQGNRKLLVWLIVLFFVMPSRALFIGKYFDKLDIYLFLILMLSIVVSYSEKLGNWRYLFITILSVVAQLIHQVYIFTYYVPVFFALLWMIVKDDYSRKSIRYTVSSLLVTALTFLYMQLFSHVRYDNLEELVRILSKRTESQFSDYMLELEYINTTSETLYETGIVSFLEDAEILVIYFLQGFPFLIAVLFFWKQVISNQSDKRCKVVYVLMQCAFMVYIPLFVLAEDWGRWMTSLYISVMSCIIMALYHNGKDVQRVFMQISGLYNKYWYLFWLFLIYEMQQQTFQVGW